MSQTNYLKLNKHDNVQTNENQFDIETYMNENWDNIEANAIEIKEKIDEITSKVNSNIAGIENIQSKDTEQDTKLLELQEENQKLRNQIPSRTS